MMGRKNMIKETIESSFTELSSKLSSRKVDKK